MDDSAALKDQLRQLIVEECDIDVDAQDIGDSDALFGDTARFGLDSLDALSIALEVKSRFGTHIDSGNETRKALASLDTLAAFIQNS